MTATKGFVVPPGGGKHLDMTTPRRFAALKLLGHEIHLHHDSDEVAWVLAGEITFKIGDEVTVGGPGTLVRPLVAGAVFNKVHGPIPT